MLLLVCEGIDLNLRVYHSVEDYVGSGVRPCTATIGTFDGVHLGHVSILKRMAAKAGQLGLPQVVVTFHPHPRVVVTPEDPPLLLTTPEEKIELLGECFHGALVFLKFDEQLRRTTAEQFARDILVNKLGVKALVVGYNHSLGHGRTANIGKLAEIGAREGFELEVVGPVTHGDAPISSSRIRRALAAGQWTDVRQMLGHRYPINGRIVRGLGQGKKMGWPTINLQWSARKLLPAEGVYSCEASVNGSRYQGMMFIGRNMLNPDNALSVEANLFDFDREVHDIEATLYPEHFIRNNAKFESLEALSKQIAADKKKVLKLID